jgi:hypothetical protein
VATIVSAIFEEQLDGRYCVSSAWPVDRTFDTFIRWFACSFHSVLVDLCEMIRDARRNMKSATQACGLGV